MMEDADDVEESDDAEDRSLLKTLSD